MAHNSSSNDSQLESACERLVEAINTALREDRILDDNMVAVNPSTRHKMVVYWRTRPRRREIRRFKRLVRRVMRQLVKQDYSLHPADLQNVAPSYAPKSWAATVLVGDDLKDADHAATDDDSEARDAAAVKDEVETKLT